MENQSSTKIVNDSEEEVTPFLESGECWDEVTFEFDDGTTLYVSQNFLSLASPVFKAMFENDFEEKRTKTVKLVGKVFGDVLELLKCLHPNIQKPVTFDNVLIVSAIAEEYQCYLIINRCKATMSEYLHSEIQRAIDNGSRIERYECALTCLKILIEAAKLNYEEQLSEAVDVITRFNFRYFTGTLLNQKPTIALQQPSGFSFSCSPPTTSAFGYAVSKPCFGLQNTNSPITPSRRVEDVAEDCKQLYESLSEKMKYSLLMKRLYQCDQHDII